ncbi:MAG: hypothetical protein IT371_30760 [Deltaproteobacteria bacterium]|nr:hypothetical protein [Deltaproteobacteria bacterium]
MSRHTRNPSADERRRAAERAGDPVAVLRERLRRGEVTTEQVRVAAVLGDARAWALEPPTDPTDLNLALGREGSIYLVGRALGDRDGLAASYAADCAERVTSVWVQRHGNDALLRSAIEAARRWVRERSADAANEARRAVRAVLASDLLVSSDRVYYAARAAAYAGEAAYVRNTDVAAANAANTAVNARIPSPGDSSAAEVRAEVHWQQDRLIAYVLREERPL